MSGDDSTKTGEGWAKLFDALSLSVSLERDGHVDLRADDIKQIADREPRLMTKFDTREARPSQLKHVTILAIRNGVYRLVAGDGYLDVPKHAAPARFNVRALQLQTLAIDCASESQVLDLAHAVGIFENFVSEDRVRLTGRGRRRSKPFDYRFRGTAATMAVSVNGVQVEIDAGYEGDRVYVVEAKIGLRDNFLVRQLYYPYRMWQAAGVTKTIVPVFVCYSNREIFIYQYDFSDPSDYHSMKLVKSAAYALDPAAQLPTFADVLQRVRPTVEPVEVPFPQADDLRRVIDVIDAVGNGFVTRRDITVLNDFAGRQGGYYAEAARYLGFIDREVGESYSLTKAGREFVRARQSVRLERVADAVASRPALRVVIDQLRLGASAEDAARNLQKLRPELSGTTVIRRIQTVRRWNALLDEWLTQAQLPLGKW